MLLALDIATQTGICFGAADTGEVPALDHFRLPSTGDDVGRFLAAFEDQINALIDRAAPTLIVFEAPVLPRAKFNPATKKVEGGVSIITTRKLQGLAGELERIAFRQGIECAEIQPSQAKQALTGKGNAKKHDMVRDCRAFGLNPHTYIHEGKEASDEADAFGVWLCALRMRHPALAGHWTKSISWPGGPNDHSPDCKGTPPRRAMERRHTDRRHQHGAGSVRLFHP